MSDKNESLNKAFELLLDDAAKAVNEHIGENINLPQEEIEFSKEHEEKMKKLFKKERKKIFSHKFYKYSIRFAYSFLIFIVISTVAVFSVNAWRVKFLNYVFDSKNPNTVFEFGDEQGGSYSNDIITFEYIPKGFEVTKNISDESGLYIKFKNNELYFTFSLNEIEGKLSIDTEEGSLQKLQINGYEAVYTTNKNVNALIWHDDEVVLNIAGNIAKEEIIKIAQKIKNKKTRNILSPFPRK